MVCALKSTNVGIRSSLVLPNEEKQIDDELFDGKRLLILMLLADELVVVVCCFHPRQ